MKTDQHKRFVSCVMTWPDWHDKAVRESFLYAALGNHPLLEGFGCSDHPRNDAYRLAQRCGEYEAIPTDSDLPPASAVLNELMECWPGVEPQARALLSELSGPKVKPPPGLDDPYPGLRAFTWHESPIFFGREDETKELLQRLDRNQDQRLLIVTGASGAGKSSLVRAGLCASLKDGKLAARERWIITAMTPDPGGKWDTFDALASSLQGADDPRLGQLQPGPIAEQLRADTGYFSQLLDQVLAGRAKHTQWLLILDQMEELFSPRCAPVRDKFLAWLLKAVRDPRFRVVATLRADFFKDCTEVTGLKVFLNEQALYVLGRPDERALASMIQKPAEVFGLRIEDALVRRMVQVASGRRGGLALLAFVLEELYREIGIDRPWTLADYHEIGGLEGAIGHKADEIIDTIRDGERLLPRVFSHLVRVDDEVDEAPLTRRRAPLRLWTAGTPERALIDALLKARLLISDKRQDYEPTLEVAHEVLLEAWPRLHAWAKARKSAFRIRDEVEAAARQWEKEGRVEAFRWPEERAAPACRALDDADLLAHLPLAKAFLEPEMERLLKELEDSTTGHSRREAIGLRLAQLEKRTPRPGVGLRPDGIPDILWRDLAVGQVEIAGHGVFEVKPFRMAAYPVTWAQYRAFLDDLEGYASQRWWRGLTRDPEPGEPLWDYLNYPVINVSWFDAVAFCRWLSERRGEIIRLPNEWEWQWAAQSGDDNFDYPWGEAWRNDAANTHESAINRTLAVGLYPAGRSRQGIDDLAGNVWEWCRNPYDNPRARKPGKEESRVLRGGSWDLSQVYARAVDRLLYHPYGRDDGIGFRVVCAPPIDTDH